MDYNLVLQCCMCYICLTFVYSFIILKRKVGRYQRGNQEHESKEEQKIQWPKEKGQAIIYKTQHRKISVERHEP
jgi:hypothetical protein